jgi:cobalamin biosynthesis Mg chelatase CobN
MEEMKSARITIKSEAVYDGASVYCFNSSGSNIEKIDDISGIENNSFEYELTPSSVYMFEFSGSDEPDVITAISAEYSESSESAESSESQSVSSALPSGYNASDDVSGAVGSSGSETVTSVTPRSGEPTGETESAGFSSETLQTENSVLPIVETVPDASVTDDFRQEEISEPDAGTSVPEFVKVIVAALVGVVILFMIYVLIYDVKLKK